jgi:signal transduction histidine kinase/ActR/RegA family two-component response regulator
MPVFKRRRSIVSLIATSASLLSVIAANFFFVGRQEAEEASVQRSLEIQLRLSQVQSLLQDAETGQRGFLLTHKEAYLEPYNAALPAIDREVASVRRIMNENGRVSPRLDAVAADARAKLGELGETIALARAGQQEDALALVETDRGKIAMERIRDAVQTMSAEERRTLAEAQAQTLRTANSLRMLTMGALSLAVLLGALTLRDARQFLRTIMEANEALQAANRRMLDEMQQREHAEAQLRQSQKLEAIGQLAGGIAHDFNNMLSVVIGNLNLLKRRAQRGDSNFLRFADGAIDGAERAAKLTHHLLAFSRQQPLMPQPVDCNHFVAGMSELLRRTLGDDIRVETVLAGGLWRTCVDPSQLESSILNLAVNGRDAMPDGGKLTIETANAYLDAAYASQNAGVQEGQYVLVSVTDTGSGMTPEVGAKAFDPFFTTKGGAKGTGLGLSQVFGFVKQSGGHIKIYTELGRGTAVKLYLPRYFGRAAESAQPSSAAEPIPVADAATTVLVVEDEPRMLVLTAEAFRDLGYSVLQADGAATALKTIAERPDIALLFTDVVMPDMTGRQLAEEALKQRPNLKVIYTTGFSRNSIIHSGVLDHDVNFLPKPFTVEELARKVAAVLREDKAS